ncbi:MAG: flippase-like domain-containing protein [Actinobacteria bacterium]|nr:flippase-like domain-containing protein [Actinomycetota bacterium]
MDGPGAEENFTTRRDALTGRIRSLGRYGFARASEEPYRRRPADAFALFFGAIVVALLASRSDDPTKFEVNLSEAFTDLPSSLRGIAELLVDLGTLWAVGIIVVAALLARRWRLTRDLFLAGFLAWLVGHVIALALGSESLGDIVDAITDASSTAAHPFPLVRIAVVTAVVAAASPYLGRPARWLSYLVVALMVPSAMYLGIATAADAVGGIALGIAAGAFVHLLFGSPGGRPTVQQVELALASLAVEADNVHLAPVQTLGRTLMLADGHDGPLSVTVLGRDERDARFLNKAVRFLFYRDSGPTLFHSRLQEVEHEAFILLRAQREGVRTPDFVEVGQAGPDAAVLVTRQVSGRPLAELATDEVTDPLLAAVWEGVARFQRAGLAHGRLDPTNVYVQDDGGVVFVGWRNASAAAPRNRLGTDIATLLYTTSLVVGADRAAAALTATFDKEELAAAVPFLQPPVVRRDLRKSQKGVKKAFGDLRDQVAAAAGVEAPELEQLRRVSRRQVVMFAAACFGIWAMIGMIGDPAELWDTIQTASWGWVVFAFACWIVVEIGYSVSMLGAIPPANDVPFGPLTLLQVASAFLNLVTSGMIAQFIMNTRFLQKRGVEVPTAVSASAVPPIAYTMVQIVIILVAFLVGHNNELSLSDIGGSDSSSGGNGMAIVLLCIVGFALVIGLVLVVPKWRHKVMPTVRTTAHNLWTVFTSPRKIVYIFGGSILTQLMYSLILWACLRAYGGDLALVDIIFINTFVSLFGGLIPVPGGIGVFEAGLTAGLTAFGVDPAIAVAAVLTDRMITAYIPPVFGYISINWMTKHDYL